MFEPKKVFCSQSNGWGGESSEIEKQDWLWPVSMPGQIGFVKNKGCEEVNLFDNKNKTSPDIRLQKDTSLFTLSSYNNKKYDIVLLTIQV